MTRAAAVELPSFADLVEEQGVKVVNISTKTQIDQPSNIPVPEDDPFYDFFRRYFCMSSTIAVDSEIEFVANPIAANTKIENDNEIEINNEVHEIEFVNNPMAANTNMENDNEKEINYEVEKTKVDSTQA